MTDIIDRAGQDCEMQLAAHIAAARKSLRLLLPKGTCYFCDELLPKVGQLFCSSECSEDHELEAAARLRAGRRDSE